MLKIIIRTAILYVAVIFGVRLMGKRQIGDLQPSELVVTLLISEIAAIPLQDSDQPILNGIISIFILVILELTVSYITMKSPAMRKLLSGKSVILIKNGVVDQNAIKNVRMTLLDLLELLRTNNVYDISTVAFAVLEVNGELNVYLKPENQPLTAKDLHIEKDLKSLPQPVITDGIIIEDSLKALDVDETNIIKILKQRKLKPQDVYLMLLDRYGNTNIIERNKK